MKNSINEVLTGASSLEEEPKAERQMSFVETIKALSPIKTVILLVTGFLISGLMFASLWYQVHQNTENSIQTWQETKANIEKLKALTNIFDGMAILKLSLDLKLVADNDSDNQILNQKITDSREKIAQNRELLLSMPLTKQEREVIDLHGFYTEKGFASQTLYQQLLTDFNDKEEALQVLLFEVNHYQAEVQNILNNLHSQIDNNVDMHFTAFEQQTQQNLKQLHYGFIWVALLSMFIGVAVLLLIWRKSLLVQHQYEALHSQAELLEEKVAERTESLYEMMEKAKVASEAKSEFLAVMSHEIRTPLNGVIGALNLMKNTELSSRQSMLLNTTLHSSELLLTIINDILDYSKIESGKLSLHLHALDLLSMVENLDNLYRPLAEAKGLNFEISTEGLQNRYVMADRNRIQQIFNNYLNNAIKFTETGSILVRMKNLENGHFYLEVKDSGIGIDQSSIDLLFQDFSQVHTGANRNFGGTGLGLAICRKLAKIMGGDVDVHSVYGQGSTFCACLDLSHLSEQSYHEKTQKPVQKVILNSSSSTQAGMKPRLLVVEDNDINQFIAKELLESEGYHVTLANHGVEAIEKVQYHYFDVILMDCHMPKMDGYEATKRLRELNVSTPIIALTANAQLSDKEKCFASGMDDFATKPFEPKVLFETIEKWLKIRSVPEPMSHPDNVMLN